MDQHQQQHEKHNQNQHHQNQNQNQQQLVDMGGYSLELASQALAATGAKSTLKATEWILNKRRAADLSNKCNSSYNAIVGKGGGGGSQSRLDLFFQSANAHPSNALQLRSVLDDDRACTSAGGGTGNNGLDESESNTSDTREDDGSENAQSVASGDGAPVAITGTRSGGARAAIVGGFDIVGGGGLPLGWRTGNSVRGEQEGVGSSGHGGGGGGGGGRAMDNDNPRFSLAKGGSRAPVTKEEDPSPGIGGGGGGTFSKVKRSFLGQEANHSGGGVGDGIGSTPKRQKAHFAEAHGPAHGPAHGAAPSPALAPIFSTPQSYRLSSKQKVGNPAVENKTPSKKSLAPLAERMRPLTVDEVVGQDAPQQMLRSLLDIEKMPPLILYGPPGTGKTSLARAIARSLSGLRFVGLSAVHSGTKEVRVVLEEASKQVKRHGLRTLLFLDEVHRFNKAQQDLFLPSVEAGSIIFIGATTENPSFEINAALLSRCTVLTLYKLEPDHLRKVLGRAIADREKGVLASLPDCVSSTGAGDCSIRVEEDALVFLAGAADGDARVALNALEIATTAAYSEAKTLIRTQKNDVIGTVPSCRGGGGGGVERIGSVNNLSGLGKSLYGGDRGGNGFGSKRLEALIENARDTSHASEDYSKPFKRFVGGKEITPLHNPARFEREVVSLSQGDGANRGAEPTDSIERKLSNPDAIVPDGADLDVGGGGPGLVVRVTLAQAREAFQRSHILYDKTGEEHYNVISALHKSMRGGDADASIYWLARMLEGGEGPLYVARRLIRFASEDVGLADPHALGVAVACYQACHFLGMPECNVNLAQCVVYLACAPKSVVVYQAIEAAQKLIRETQQNEPVPLHLRNAPTRLMKDMGYGKGYIYPPGHPGRVEQEYMPPSLGGHKFLQWPEMRD
ncbi:unnamed protein product [Calypogeia fissa]